MSLMLFLTVLGLVFLLLAAGRVPEKYVSYGWFGLFLIYLATILK